MRVEGGRLVWMAVECAVVGVAGMAVTLLSTWAGGESVDGFRRRRFHQPTVQTDLNVCVRPPDVRHEKVM